MKLLTILLSADLEPEVSDLVSAADIDCYVKQPNAYGVSHRCEGTIGDEMDWDAVLMMIAGKGADLEDLAGKIQAKMSEKEYKPCLRMMLSPVDKVWM